METGLTLEDKKKAIAHQVVPCSLAMIIGVNLFPTLIEGKPSGVLMPKILKGISKLLWDKYMEELSKKSSEEIDILFQEMVEIATKSEEDEKGESRE